MITWQVKGLDGKWITMYRPETVEDIEKLMKLPDLDDRDSFGDDPERLEIGPMPNRTGTIPLKK